MKMVNIVIINDNVFIGNILLCVCICIKCYVNKYINVCF